MTDPRTKKKPAEKKTEEPESKGALAEVLLQCCLTHALERNMQFGEVVGHIELCKLELFKRQTDAAVQNAEPQEGADTAETEPSPSSEEAQG